MGFKEVQSLDADVVIALGKKDKTGKSFPKQAEGYFLGSRKVQNKRGESNLHFLKTDDGNLGIWGTTDLDRKLGSVPAGTMVRVTYTGKKPTPNGDMYVYKVEVDSTNTIEVDTAALNASAGNTEEDEAQEVEEEEAGEGYTDEDEADALQAAALAAAERKAKVAALLKGAKSKTK